jgi:hypothetical protein
VTHAVPDELGGAEEGGVVTGAGELGCEVGSDVGSEVGGADDDDELVTGLGDAGPALATQWSRTEWAGHFVATATDTRVSVPDATQP